MEQPRDYYHPDSRVAEAISPRAIVHYMNGNSSVRHETVCYLCGERTEHCECESQVATWRIRVMEGE
jgi:hypothetical protein